MDNWIVRDKMVTRVPHYYKNFVCIADKCKDNCCVGGWEIEIDDDTIEYYKSLEDSISKELFDNITQDDDGAYCFRLKEGKCAFLKSNGLCGLYEKVGEEHLGTVCKEFPRFTEYFDNIIERGIGLACEEAARIILTDRKTFSLECLEGQVDGGIQDDYIDTEFDSELFSILEPFRNDLITFVESDILTINEKLIIALDLGEKIQECINVEDYEGIREVVSLLKDAESFQAYYEELTASNECGLNNEDFYDYLRDVLTSFEDLEFLKDDWQRICMKLNDMMDGNCDYKLLSKSFENVYSDSNRELENLIKYLLYRYLLKSCYDQDVIGKIKFIVIYYLLVKAFEISCFNGNDKYSFEDRMNILHIFSREIEYSEDNIETIYENFMFDDVFETDSLVQMILFNCI